MRREDSPFYDHPAQFPLRLWRGEGIRAIDGDTVTAFVETGPHSFEVLDLRLSTIDTYEIHSGPAEWRAKGIGARQFTEERVVDKWLRVVSVMDTEKYGRTLTAIEYQDPAGAWLDLADHLRAAGYEKPHASAQRADEVHAARSMIARARYLLANGLAVR